MLFTAQRQVEQEFSGLIKSWKCDILPRDKMPLNLAF